MDNAVRDKELVARAARAAKRVLPAKMETAKAMVKTEDNLPNKTSLLTKLSILANPSMERGAIAPVAPDAVRAPEARHQTIAGMVAACPIWRNKILEICSRAMAAIHH